jgi:hypothetical protein
LGENSNTIFARTTWVTGAIHATTRRSKRHDGILKQACGGVIKIIAVICEYLVRLLDYRGLMGDPVHSFFFAQIIPKIL